MIGISLALSPGNPALRKGGDFIPGSAVDLMFDRGSYRLNGQPVPLSTIDGYHSRASSAWRQNASGIWNEFATGVAPILPGVGYDGREGVARLNANALNPRAWTVDGATVSDEVGTFLGFSSAERVASNGGGFHRIRTDVSGGYVNGSPYAVRVLYGSGSSGCLRITLRNNTGGTESLLSGPVGALASTTTVAGTWSNIVNINHGSGIYEIQAIFTATSTGASANIGIGPDSATVGQDVVVIAGQIPQTPYQMPFGSGTTAADTLIIPAADAGMAVNPSVTGVTMFWRGMDFQSAANFPRIAEIRVDGSNRLSFIRSASTGTVSIDLFSGGASSSVTSTLANAPRGTEFTILATWRPDGTYWGKIGSNTAGTGTRAPFASNLASIGVGNNAGAGDISNHITRRAGFLPTSLSDSDALALFNAINAGL